MMDDFQKINEQAALVEAKLKEIGTAFRELEKMRHEAYRCRAASLKHGGLQNLAGPFDPDTVRHVLLAQLILQFDKYGEKIRLSEADFTSARNDGLAKFVARKTTAATLVNFDRAPRQTREVARA